MWFCQQLQEEQMSSIHLQTTLCQEKLEGGQRSGNCHRSEKGGQRTGRSALYLITRPSPSPHERSPHPHLVSQASPFDPQHRMYYITSTSSAVDPRGWPVGDVLHPVLWIQGAGMLVMYYIQCCGSKGLACW